MHRCRPSFCFWAQNAYSERCSWQRHSQSPCAAVWSRLQPLRRSPFALRNCTRVIRSQILNKVYRSFMLPCAFRSHLDFPMHVVPNSPWAASSQLAVSCKCTVESHGVWPTLNHAGRLAASAAGVFLMEDDPTRTRTLSIRPWGHYIEVCELPTACL